MNVYNIWDKYILFEDIYLLLLSEVLAESLTDWCYRQAKSVRIYKKIMLLKN